MFAQKTGPLAQSYLEGAVAFCQGVADEIVPNAGIIFEPQMISKTMVDPPPGWNANEHELVETVWWEDYLDQLLKAVPLQGGSRVKLLTFV